jgi:hypothetical protein
MTRLERKNWPSEKFGLLGRGSIFDALDDAVKYFTRMTDDEYDKYCEIATDEQIGLLVSKELSFADKRCLLNLLREQIYE